MKWTSSLYFELTGIASRSCSIDFGAHFLAHLALRAVSLSLCLSRTACSNSPAPAKETTWLKSFEYKTLVLKDKRILSNALHLTEWDTLVHLIRSSLSYYGQMALIESSEHTIFVGELFPHAWERVLPALVPRLARNWPRGEVFGSPGGRVTCGGRSSCRRSGVGFCSGCIWTRGRVGSRLRGVTLGFPLKTPISKPPIESSENESVKILVKAKYKIKKRINNTDED